MPQERRLKPIFHTRIGIDASLRTSATHLRAHRPQMLPKARGSTGPVGCWPHRCGVSTDPHRPQDAAGGASSGDQSTTPADTPPFVQGGPPSLRWAMDMGRGGGGSKPPPSLYKVPTYSTRAGAAPRAPGGARHGGGNRAVNSQPRTGQSTSYRDVKSSYGGAGGWDRRGCATGAPRSATRQGEEQHRHTERGSLTKRDKGGHSRQGGGAQQGRRGNQNSGNREPEWSGWWSVHGRQRQ